MTSEVCPICGEEVDANEVDPHDHFSTADDDPENNVPPHRSGPGYGGAPVELVEEVADAIGKTADQVTSDDVEPTSPTSGNRWLSPRSRLRSLISGCTVSHWGVAGCVARGTFRRPGSAKTLTCRND